MIAVRRVVEDGERPSEVMRSLGLCRTTIYLWLRAYKKKGPAALLLRKASGPRPKLNAKQRQNKVIRSFRDKETGNKLKNGNG